MFNTLKIPQNLYRVSANYTNVIKKELWTPTNTLTVFWYDAADTSTITATGNQVTQMLDKSGNGWTVAPTTAGKIGPDTGTRTLNGLNVIEYSKTALNTNQILESNTFSQTQPFCIACVFRFDDEGLDDQDFIFSGTETVNPRISVRRTTNDSLQILTSAGTFGTAAGSVTENNNYLTSFFLNSTASTIRLNGSQSATGTIGNIPFTSLNVGGNFNEDQSLDGFIAELVAFVNPLDQEIVEGYLAHKWGLQTNLPLVHPYKATPPTV